MTRILVDPLELNALATLWRNASFDAAGVAAESSSRADTVNAALVAGGRTAEAERLRHVAVEASRRLLSIAAALDDDALLLAAIGQRTETADALAEAFGGGEHALLRRLRADPGESE